MILFTGAACGNIHLCRLGLIDYYESVLARDGSAAMDMRLFMMLGAFAHIRDWLAIVASWADPTDETLRDQYGLEIDYSFRFTPHSTLTPHVQLIRDPSLNLSNKNISVIGLRAKFDF